MKMNQWYDGGSDQWLWVGNPGPLVYVFAEIIDLPGYCGSDAETQWSASVSVVDIKSSGLEVAASALGSCGWMPGDLATKEEEGDMLLALAAIDEPMLRPQVKRETWNQIADAMFSYGAKSPMWNKDSGSVERPCPDGCEGVERYKSESFQPRDEFGRFATSEVCETCNGCGELYADDEESRSFIELKREAFAQAAGLANSSARESRLDGAPVNAIGQTAREYAQGLTGLYDALRRQPEDSIIRRMYSKAGQTLGGCPVPSDI